jgi:hypothetical protein
MLKETSGRLFCLMPEALGPPHVSTSVNPRPPRTALRILSW